MRIVLDAYQAAMDIDVNLLALAAKITFAIKIRDPALMVASMVTTGKRMVHAVSDTE